MANIIARQLRAAFWDAGTAVDFYFAGVLATFGVYFLQPHWMLLRYSRITREMIMVAPLWAWGAGVLILALSLAVATIWRSNRLLSACYVVSFGYWMMIGWIFCFGAAVPPIEGLVAPLAGFLAVVRASQIPPEKKCAH